MTPRTTTLRDPIYGGVHYGIYAPQEKLHATARRLLPAYCHEHLTFDEHMAGNTCVMHQQGGALTTLVIVPVDDDLDPLNVLAHETFHASTQTLDHVGARLSDDSQEAFAYHFSWLFEGLRKGLKL